MASGPDCQLLRSRGVEGSVTQGGFLSSLVTVGAGAYASNPPTYGSSSPILLNYNSVTATASSGASVRKSGDRVDFSLSVTLNADAAAPVANEELRIRAINKLDGTTLADAPCGRRSTSGLPSVAAGSTLPLFTDVDIIDTATGLPPAALGVAGQFAARLLHNGDLALVSVDLTAAPQTQTALTSAEITAAFGGPTAELRVSVRGSYRARA